MKKRPLIMTVDDEHEILRLLSRTLEPEGYGVIATCYLIVYEAREPI